MNNREKTATTLVHSVNAHTRIRLDEMDKPGTYIISFWNDKPLANGLHTVAVSYNGSSYRTYNIGDDKYSPRRTWKNIRKTVGKAFGASASVVYQKTRKVNTKHILYLFTYEHVSSITTVTSAKGNSASVVSFYANGIAPDYYNPNAGMQVNIGDISINANLAIDDIRIFVTTTSGDTSYQSSIRANATELKIGFESAIITKVDEHTFETEKINYSMSGMLLYALYVAATTGDWRGVPATAMRG